MAITLSWDLFVIVFFAVIITYSMIIGKHESVKIIISTYIAIVAAQGLGNLFARLTGGPHPLFQLVGLNIDVSILSTIKLLLFILTIVFLAVRGGFAIEYQKDAGSVVDTLVTALFGFATAGLMLSTLITFVADVPLLDEKILQNASVMQMMKDTTLMAAMVTNQDLWFTLPAMILVAIGFMHTEIEE